MNTAHFVPVLDSAERLFHQQIKTTFTRAQTVLALKNCSLRYQTYLIDLGYQVASDLKARLSGEIFQRSFFGFVL